MGNLPMKRIRYVIIEDYFIGNSIHRIQFNLFILRRRKTVLMLVKIGLQDFEIIQRFGRNRDNNIELFFIIYNYIFLFYIAFFYNKTLTYLINNHE